MNTKNNEVGIRYFFKNYIMGFNFPTRSSVFFNAYFKYIYIFGIIVVFVCVFVAFFYTFIENFTVERFEGVGSLRSGV